MIRLKSIWEKLGAVLLCIGLAAVGSFVIYKADSFLGLAMGAGFVLLGLAVAFPTQLHTGVITFKANAQELDEVVDGFVGRRKTDRRDDGSVVVVPNDLPAEPVTEANDGQRD